MRTHGVLALCPREPRWLLVPEQRQQLQTLAALTAMALERDPAPPRHILTETGVGHRLLAD